MLYNCIRFRMVSMLYVTTRGAETGGYSRQLSATCMRKQYQNRVSKTAEVETL
jgi:hypothetical protein